MSTQSFADLGVSDAVARALAAPRHHRALRNPAPRDRRRPRRPRRARRSRRPGPARRSPSRSRSPTGSPPTDRRPAALVLAPTRELASQIVEESRAVAHARALKIAAVYGGVGIAKQAREAAKAHILVATPGRLEDLLERRAVSLAQRPLPGARRGRPHARHGLPAGRRPHRRPSARPSARRCSSRPRSRARRAASPASTRATPVRHEHAPPAQRKAAIEHRFVAVSSAPTASTRSSRELRAERDLALVFVRTKRGADRLVKRLGSQGVQAVAMHGDKSQGQRERALAGFESGRVDTLVATDVAARGIHVDGHLARDQLRPARRTATATCTASAAPAAPGGPASGSPSSAPSRRTTCRQIAGQLKLHAEFERSGLGARRTSPGRIATRRPQPRRAPTSPARSRRRA